jgi:hypothetical protein
MRTSRGRICDVEQDRFDDVGFEVLESPDEQRPSRGGRGRRVLTGVAALLATGAIATGAALAVTGTGGSAPKAHKAPAGPAIHYTADGIPTTHSGATCLAGQTKPLAQHHRHRSAPKY